MSQHIIPQDSYNHIQSFACGCTPTVVLSEGEEMYIHNTPTGSCYAGIVGKVHTENKTISWLDAQEKAWGGRLERT